MTDFTVITDNNALELKQLRQFYKDVATLVLTYDVLYTSEGQMFNSQLTQALNKVDPKWYESN